MPAWIALAAISAMLVVCAVGRFPIWNPTYFFGVLFGLQIGAGFIFAERLDMEIPLGFSLPLLGAYVLALGILLGFSLRDREVVARSPDVRRQFRSVDLSPSTMRVLVLVLACIAVHNTAVNLAIIIEWRTLPVVAYNLYRGAFAMATPGVTLPQDVGSAFSVPFFSVVADHLVNPAVVAYLALLFLPKQQPTEDWDRVGFRSVPWWVHALIAAVVLNAAIVHRRNPLLMGIFTAVLLLYLLRRLSRTTVLIAGVVLLAGTVAFGQLRRGQQEFRAAVALGLPPVAGNTMIYEPLVYAGSGVPNFLRYWADDHPPAMGDLLLSAFFPRPIDEALGLEVNRGEMLRRMFGDGFVIPGQTLRTPWFEAYFDFGWVGVYVIAVFFPTGVYWLYRRALLGSARGAPSVAFFTLAKVIYLFPFINLLFQLPFWTTAVMAILIDRELARSMSPARTRQPIVGVA